MKAAIVGKEKAIINAGINTLVQGLLNNDIILVEIIDIDNKKKWLKSLREFELVITIDLAGFEQCTLTDGLSYNLISSKFIHFLLHENLPNEKYLSKQLSISMFFYCVGSEYRDYLLKTYPEMPWLKELTGWNIEETQNMESNAACIVAAIEEVMRECRL